MATKKSISKKTKASLYSTTRFDDNATSLDTKEEFASSKPSSSKTPYIIIGLAIVLLAILAVTKGWVISALVNGKPIFRFQLAQSLMSRYGKQTLEGMISEHLIYDEGKKAGIVITQKDIDQKEAEILKSFGGNVSLDEVLTYQGMTKADFDNQVKVQLVVYKLLGKDIGVNDEEIKAFIEKNRSSLVATTEAEMNQEAKTALLDQKINEKVQPWFEDVKNNAKVFRFNQ